MIRPLERVIVRDDVGTGAPGTGPESALSLRSSPHLLALLHGVAASESQVLLATHSPVLAALPGATVVYELDGEGFTARKWAELDLVQDWTAFFADPGRLLHHLLDG